MALGKDRVDWKAIDRDQKAIDKLPNKGRVKDSKKKALEKVKKTKKLSESERATRYGQRKGDFQMEEQL